MTSPEPLEIAYEAEGTRRRLPVFSAVTYDLRTRVEASKLKGSPASGPEAFVRAGRAMARRLLATGLFKRGSAREIFVPVPGAVAGRRGTAAALAEQIAHALGAGAEARSLVVRVTTVPSSYLARKNGTHSPTFEEHVASMRLSASVPRGRSVWIVDNVITTGATIAAVAQVLGVQVAGAIVFADATEYVSPFNPPRPARCRGAVTPF